MIGPTRGRSGLIVGFLAIAGVLSFSALFIYATNRTLGAERATIFVRLDAADGLQRGDAVLLRGVNVGEVKALEFDGSAVVVRVRLARAVPLTSLARAEMVAADVFGRQSIVLRPAHEAGPPLAHGDTLHGRGPVSLTARFDKLGRHADRLLGDSTIDLIRGTLEGAGGATASAGAAAAQIGVLAANADRLIAEQRASLDVLTREAGVFARRMSDAAAAPELASVPARLDSSAASLVSATRSMDSAAASLARVLADLEAGRGSAGMLLRDSALYARTTGALGALERLLDDVRANPKRYVTIRVF
jgi:phospholipid/cholesterol/gamma-HCH transport system substrate-binding protein